MKAISNKYRGISDLLVRFFTVSTAMLFKWHSIMYRKKKFLHANQRFKIFVVKSHYIIIKIYTIQCKTVFT